MITYKPTRWMFIESGESKTTLGGNDIQLIGALNARGVEPTVVRVNDKGNFISTEELRRVIREQKPNVIAFNGPHPWMLYSDVFADLNKILKINFWFDDPMIRINATNISSKIIVARGRQDFLFTCWDEYWANVLRGTLGLEAYHLSLSANPKDFYPCEHYLTDDAVFVGSLHSPLKILGMVHKLPTIFQYFVEQVRKELIAFEPFPVPSWDQMMKYTEHRMLPGMRKLFDQQCKVYANELSTLQWVVWALSKNHVRVEMLKRALKQTNVMIYTETKQVAHANAQEIREMLGEFDKNKLKIGDTTGINPDALGQFYHYGKVHLQAVDPQSVTSGIPYRTYQASASKRPLITDIRDGWRREFTVNEDFLVYNSWGEFDAVLQKALSDDSLLDATAERAYKRFLASQTWDHRLEELENHFKDYQSGFSEEMFIDGQMRNVMPGLSELLSNWNDDGTWKAAQQIKQEPCVFGSAYTMPASDEIK